MYLVIAFNAHILNATARSDSARIAALLKKHMDVVYTDTVKAGLYLTQAIALAEKTRQYHMLVRALNTKARMYLIQGKLGFIPDVIKKSLEIKDKLPSKRLLSSTYSNLGHYHYQISEYDKSIEAHLQAARIAEEFGDSVSLARSYNNMGNVYVKLSNYNKALNHYKKAYAITKNQGYNPGMAHVLGNLGLVYSNLNMPDSAKIAVYQSLQLHKQLDLKNQVALNYSNLAKIHERLNQRDSARFYYLRFYEISDSINDINGKISALLQLSKNAFARRNTTDALRYLNDVYPLLQGHRSNEFSREYYFLLSEIQAFRGNFEEAFENRLLYEAWKDSTINSEHLKEIERIETQYETEKKEIEILTLSQQNLIQEQQLAQRNMLLRSLGIGFLVLVIIGGLSFALYSQRTKNKQQLAIIDAISQTQENERKRIATALHDSIGSALAGIKIQIENVFSDRYPSKSTRKTVQLIDETANEVRRISHDLIPGVLLKLGLEDSLKDMINQIDNNTSIQASYESFGMDQRLPSESEVKIFRICQELVQNALKHGKPERLILQITRHANKLNIIIEDNGHGFNKSRVASDGIGMANMKHQVSSMKGNLQVESTKGQGTTVIIDIPVT